MHRELNSHTNNVLMSNKKYEEVSPYMRNQPLIERW